MTSPLTLRRSRVCVVPVFALLSVACGSTRLPECEQLTTAIADGSSNAMRKSGTLEDFKTALTAAADKAVNISVTSAPRDSAGGVDLGTPRDAYVKILRSAATEATVAGHSPARSALVNATAKALDTINLRCSGER